MRILLDTHIALWAITDSPKLPQEACSRIISPQNEIYFSAASVWEIAIKHRLARREMPISGKDAAELFLESGYIELVINSLHTAATEDLPMHHADPFDRLLVAQAITEPMHLLTHDRMLAQYGDLVLYA